MSYNIDTLNKHVQQQLTAEQANDCKCIYKAAELRASKLKMDEFRIKIWLYPAKHYVKDMDINSLFTRDESYEKKDQVGNKVTETRPQYHIVFKIMEPDENDFTDFFYQVLDRVVRLNKTDNIESIYA